MWKATGLTVACLLCGACGVQSNLPLGPSAYDVVPATMSATGQQDYVVASFDTVNVTVFQEPDLSVQNAQVDSSGKVVIPLVGPVQMAGKTVAQVSEDLTTRLTRYVHKPSVSVTVNSIRQKVAVEGSVNQPGIYDIPGRASLIETLAMARSPSQYAALDQVIVFRNVGGEPRAARFDLRRIRTGLDPDPVILPGDRVVVGSSAFKEAWRDYFSNSVLNVFRVL
jgi:polysaccharide biosynthesis/export protein